VVSYDQAGQKSFKKRIMVRSMLSSKTLIFLLSVCLSIPTVSGQLAGTWQHTETGAQVRFENQVYQNYDHIGYYAGGGTYGVNYYVGEDIIYLTSAGNNQYSGYLKGKTNLTQITWIVDTWTVTGNTAYSTAKGNFQKVGGYQSFPNIAGTWYINSDPNQPAYIQQNGQYLSFQVDQYQSQGYFSADKQLWATSWNAAATLSADYRTITWGNQTWTKTVSSTSTYPSIAGTWYHNGNANVPCTITQNGQYVAFSLGNNSSQGYFTSARELFASDWNTTASLSADNNTITWGNQQWTRYPGSTPEPATASGFNSTADYRVIAKHTGKVLDVYGGRIDDGANVYQWDWHGDNNQRWKIEQQSDGYYRIVSKNSGKVLDIRGNSTANNANVYQYGWHGGDNQRWKLESLNNGYYKITSKHSGKVLEIEGASTANGGNLDQYDWHGGDNQQWKIEWVNGGSSTSTTGGLLETVNVSGAARDKTYSTNMLQSGRSYTLQISGSYNVWSATDPIGVDALYCYHPSHCPTPKLWSGLWIDDKPLKDYIEAVGGSTAYNPNHTYQVTVTGKGAKMGFGCRDGSSYGGGDNSGTIYVKIIAN
jgi:hypothetical protein